VTGVAGLFPAYLPLLTFYFFLFLKKSKKGTLPPLPPAGSSNPLILFNPNDNHYHLKIYHIVKAYNPLILH
jgi:hypothetical protein